MAKFKVGDGVTIVDKGYISVGQHKKIGNGVIDKVSPRDEMGWNYYTFENGYRNSYRDDHLELVICDFKIKDEIKLAIPLCRPNYKYDGEVGKIIAIDRVTKEVIVDIRDNKVVICSTSELEMI